MSLFVFRILIHKNYLSKLFNAIFQNGWAPRNGHFIVVFLSEVDFSEERVLEMSSFLK